MRKVIAMYELVFLLRIVILYMVLHKVVHCEKTVEYYEQLFAKYENESKRYTFPVDNSDFFVNATEDKVHDYGEFDFIIVGAGSSGSVIANRLSEIYEWNILLIEAGGEEDDFSDIPGVFGTLQSSRMNWGYLTTPQTTCCLGMKNRQCSYPRGKVLGGSSTINALMYVRGNRKDYDKWEELGNLGWNYEKVLHYFIRSENSEIYSNDYHGNDGLLNVDYPEPPSALLDTFIQGNLQLGRKYLDYNGREQLGFSRTQLNIKNGKRVSGGNSFIKQARNRRNLNISSDSLVTRILTATSWGEINAYGIEFIKGGRKFRATTKKEVILSAGTINTPQILKLSGIGPLTELSRLNIPLVKDIPAVGSNMKDHPVYFGLVFRTNYTETQKNVRETIKEYMGRKGPLTSAGPTYGIGFIETKDSPDGVPDIEYLFLPPYTSLPINPRVYYNPSEEMLKHFFVENNRLTDLAIYIILLHPKSSGKVLLKSSDPKDFPDININYFSDKENHDIETVYRGVQSILNLTKTDAFKRINATYSALIPGCDHLNKNTREYWYCTIRTATSTLYHPTGTARMGKRMENSVVDAHLKVHGIKNLRVADASVIPSSVSGHTNAASFMIGERASDFIKRDYGKW